MDYECPPCKSFEKDKLPILKIGRRIRVVIKNLPLPMHKHAFSAAVAAKIAEAGRKFDEVHKSLVLCNDINEDKISIVMKNNGFFQNRTPLMKNRRAVSKVNEDMGIASRLNLQGTPSFVLCKIDKSVWLLPKVLDQIDSVLKK